MDNKIIEDENCSEECMDIAKENKYRYAGFWMRFWAYLLDLIIVASINGIIVTPLFLFTNLRGTTILFFSIEAIVISIVTFLYFLLLTKKWGQTIGKRVFGIKVIQKDEQPLSWSSVIFREVIGRYIIQAFALTYLLYLIVSFQKQKRGLHDFFGDTYVIHEEI